mmetsp:Transcript_21977/g.61475  ORF Transcript_21977/g.61475 Transcript_21977/m.61475 type:complete len:204 (+) Transcript_21977:346-957(+)
MKSASTSKRFLSSWKKDSSTLAMKVTAMEEYRMSGTAWKLRMADTPHQTTSSTTPNCIKTTAKTKYFQILKRVPFVTRTPSRVVLQSAASFTMNNDRKTTMIHFIVFTDQPVCTHGVEGISVTGTALGLMSCATRKRARLCKNPMIIDKIATTLGQSGFPCTETWPTAAARFSAQRFFGNSVSGMPDSVCEHSEFENIWPLSV